MGVERSAPTFFAPPRIASWTFCFRRTQRCAKLPEPIFEPEYDAATSLGFKCLLFDEEALCAGGNRPRPEASSTGGAEVNSFIGAG